MKRRGFLVLIAVILIALFIWFLGPYFGFGTYHPLDSEFARLIAIGIAISTLGFLSQSILTAPRVYYAMARDGVFFRQVGLLDPRTKAPVVAIILQGVWAVVVALSGRYEQILNYVVTIDVLFFGLTGATLFVFRARSKRDGDKDSPKTIRAFGSC